MVPGCWVLALEASGVRVLGYSVQNPKALLGGSRVVISGVISPVTCIVTLLITPFIATREPPSRS